MTGLVCGIDEAGRGPVIGPLVIGCVVLDDNARKELRKLNVRDSKKVAKSRRESLELKIKDLAIEYRIARIQPNEIDWMRKKESLNMIEARKTAELIMSLENSPHKIIVDAADSVAENYRERIMSCINSINNDFRIPELISEHKADDNYLEVSAASILAKVDRDREIELLKEDLGDFGSGYPSDAITQEFIRECVRSGNLPDCVRKSWNTLNKSKQTSLFEF